MLKERFKRKGIPQAGSFEIVDLEDFPHDGSNLKSDGAQLRGALLKAMLAADVSLPADSEAFSFGVTRPGKRAVLAVGILYDFEIVGAIVDEVELLCSSFVHQLREKPPNLAKKVRAILDGLAVEPEVKGRPARKFRLR